MKTIEQEAADIIAGQSDLIRKYASALKAVTGKQPEVQKVVETKIVGASPEFLQKAAEALCGGQLVSGIDAPTLAAAWAKDPDLPCKVIQKLASHLTSYIVQGKQVGTVSKDGGGTDETKNLSSSEAWDRHVVKG